MTRNINWDRTSIRVVIPALWIVLLAGVMLFSGCGSAKPGCLGDKSENLQIRWGFYYSNAKKTAGYILKPDKYIYLYEIPAGSRKDLIQVSKITNDDYCKILTQTRSTILKTQAINFPGDTLNFIEYDNPETNIQYRAVWNPKFTNAGNKAFRQLYDSLQVLLTKELEKK